VLLVIRLARPGSWWDRHIDGPDKRRRAEHRYGSASRDEVAESVE